VALFATMKTIPHQPHGVERSLPRFQRLLIPLDGSALSEQILGPALELGGLARLLLGSVADKVLRGATLPMLITRPQS
jgi:hypothetical protein